MPYKPLIEEYRGYDVHSERSGIRGKWRGHAAPIGCKFVTVTTPRFGGKGAKQRAFAAVKKLVDDVLDSEPATSLPGG